VRRPPTCGLAMPWWLRARIGRYADNPCRVKDASGCDGNGPGKMKGHGADGAR
jgi:hypothetical protein